MRYPESPVEIKWLGLMPTYLRKTPIVDFVANLRLNKVERKNEAYQKIILFNKSKTRWFKVDSLTLRERTAITRKH